MISFGDYVPAYHRMAFKRPRPANPNFVPGKTMHTRFSTHLQPFSTALPSAASYKPSSFPPGSPALNPGVTEGPDTGRPQQQRRRVRRVVPGAQAAIQPGQVVTRATLPSPKTTAGAMGAGPYTGMTVGDVIPFRQSPNNIRQGILEAPQIVRGMHSPGYPYAAVSAGGFRRSW